MLALMAWNLTATTAPGHGHYDPIEAEELLPGSIHAHAMPTSNPLRVHPHAHLKSKDAVGFPWPENLFHGTPDTKLTIDARYRSLATAAEPLSPTAAAEPPRPYSVAASSNPAAAVTSTSTSEPLPRALPEDAEAAVTHTLGLQDGNPTKSQKIRGQDLFPDRRAQTCFPENCFKENFLDTGQNLFVDSMITESWHFAITIHSVYYAAVDCSAYSCSAYGLHYFQFVTDCTSTIEHALELDVSKPLSIPKCNPLSQARAPDQEDDVDDYVHPESEKRGKSPLIHFYFSKFHFVKFPEVSAVVQIQFFLSLSFVLFLLLDFGECVLPACVTVVALTVASIIVHLSGLH